MLRVTELCGKRACRGFVIGLIGVIYVGFL